MLQIHRIPAFNDNYLWLFHNQHSKLAYVVDPGDAAPIIEALEKLELRLNSILITHHHADHTGGVKALLEKYGVPVYGPKSPNIPQVTVTLSEGEKLQLQDCPDFEVLEVPGHTLDHIAYFSSRSSLNKSPVLFCGDTLFAGGCGRVFEGSPEQMWSSLSKLSALDKDTNIYCAHEYTTANLAFAEAVESDNTALRLRVESTRQARAKGQATVPSTLSLEHATNPFLRCQEQGVIQSASRHTGQALVDPTQVFAAIRQWKDNF